MAKIFLTSPGTVKVITSGISVGSVKFPQLLGTNNNSQKIIITGIQYNQDANVQFMPTLSDSIYVYSFGDKIGNIIVNGMVFARGCVGRQEESVTGATHGVNLLLQAYQDNKVSNDQNPSVKIAIGTEVIEGFLIGLRINRTDRDFDLYDFNMIIATLPKVTKTPTASKTKGLSKKAKETFEV